MRSIHISLASFRVRPISLATNSRITRPPFRPPAPKCPKTFNRVTIAKTTESKRMLGTGVATSEFGGGDHVVTEHQTGYCQGENPL